MDYRRSEHQSDAHLLLLRDEVADVGGRRRCHHHVTGTVPHRRRVRAHSRYDGRRVRSTPPGATKLWIFSSAVCSGASVGSRELPIGASEGEEETGRINPSKPVKRGDKKVPNIGGKFLSHRRSRPSKICLAAVGRRFLGSRTGTFAFFFRDRLRPAGRALDTTRVSAPTGSPRTRSHRQATRPALERKALKDPRGRAPTPLKGGARYYLEIIQRQRR